MKINSFNELFLILLSDVYFLEQQIVTIFPKMIEKTHTQELKDLLQNHLIETRLQIQRIEHIFSKIGVTSQKIIWENPVKSLFNQADQFLEANTSSPLLDAAIIAIVQKIEHLEIATYGTLKEYAVVIDMPEAEKFLEDSLKETEKVDAALNKLAKGKFFTTGIIVEAAGK